MARSLSSLAYNFAEGIYKINVSDIESESANENSIKYKCLSRNKNCSNKIDEKLKKQFKKTFKFSNNDMNQFILLLRKGVYPYEKHHFLKKKKNLAI